MIFIIFAILSSQLKIQRALMLDIILHLNVTKSSGFTLHILFRYLYETKNCRYLPTLDLKRSSVHRSYTICMSDLAFHFETLI